jgi:radical SAM superfamily enzyme YgiQ (UPF0313 family)
MMSPFEKLHQTQSVLCIYPWEEGVSVTNWFPPLGLECIAAAIENAGITTHTVDMRFEPDPAPLAAFPAETVCISVNWDDQIPILPDLLQNFNKDQCIIVGGRAATFNSEEIFNLCPQVSIIVRGDGEQTIDELFSQKPLEAITGLSYRKKGEIHHNQNRRFDTIPEEIYPDRSRRNYSYSVRMGNCDTGIAFDLLSSSRGCPFNCKFCTFSRNPLGEKRPWCGRSPESVVNELEELDANYVMFTDDHFSVDLKRVERICDLIIQRNIKKTLAVALRIEAAFHEKVVEKMFAAGFKFLSLGFESAVDKTLAEMEKGFDTCKAREACKLLRKHPFILVGYFLVGNIGEDKEDMLKIADFADELGLDFIYPSYLKIEKYSALEDLVNQSQDYYVDKKGYICSTQYSRDALKDIRRRIHKRFYTISKSLSIAGKVIRFRLINWNNALTIASTGWKHKTDRDRRIQQQG